MFHFLGNPSNQKLSNNHKKIFSKYYQENKDRNNRNEQIKCFELDNHYCIDISFQISLHNLKILKVGEGKKNQNNKLSLILVL